MTFRQAAEFWRQRLELVFVQVEFLHFQQGAQDLARDLDDFVVAQVQFLEPSARRERHRQLCDLIVSELELDEGCQAPELLRDTLELIAAEVQSLELHPLPDLVGQFFELVVWLKLS